MTDEPEPTFEEPQIADIPLKRRRGRPPKSVTDATFSSDGLPTEEKKTRTRRSTKLTGKDVELIVTQMFDLVAMFTNKPYWRVAPEEVTPWADSAAKLANSIPAKYINGFAQSSAYIAVGIGMYGIVNRRLQYEAQLKAEAKQRRVQPVQQAAPETPSSNGTYETTVDDLFRDVAPAEAR